jgi:MFS family permease
MIAQVFAGILISRTGSRRVVIATAILACLAMPLPMAAPTISLFFAAAVMLGATIGSLNVAINTHATELEAAGGRPLMPSFHGIFSVGSLAGAVVGAWAIARGWGNGSGAAVAAVACLALVAGAAPYLLRTGRPETAGPRFVLPSRSVIGLGLLAFVSFAIEGGVTDWSALFLSTVKEATPAAAASGFALFSLAMAGVRLAGNQVVAVLGPRKTASLGGSLVAVGFAMTVAAPWVTISALGLALVGIGAANVVPIIYSAAARSPGVPPGIAVAAVGTLGIIGFLVGPPVIGFIATAFGLSAGFGLLALAGVTVAVASALRRW